jgi:hypothetical protein
MEKSIYTITVIHKKPDKPDSINCIGLFENKELAEKLVLSNSMDMNEAGYYPYVVVERLALNSIYFIKGSHGNSSIMVNNQQWFCWVGEEDGQYEKCDIPDWAKNIYHWI